MTVFITNNKHVDHYKCVNFFKSLGHSVIETAENAEIIVFLSEDRRLPSIMYGVNSVTVEETNHTRAMIDYKLFKNYNNNKLLIGFNTSALYLAVMSGCKIIHRLRTHNEMHSIDFEKNKGVMSAGFHSQLMYPYDMKPSDFKVHATSGIAPKLISYFKDDTTLFNYDLNLPEPEIVYFRKTNVLAIQAELYTASLKSTITSLKDLIECSKQENITV